MQIREKIKQRAGREEFLQLQLTGQKTDLLPHLIRLLHHADAIHHRVSFIRTDQCREHTQSGRFTSPVRAKQPKDLSLIRGKRQMIDRTDLLLMRPFDLLLPPGERKRLAQPVYLQNFLFHNPCPPLNNLIIT